MPTFHHWRAGKQRNGLTFQTAADARAFDKGIIRAYDELIDGLCPIIARSSNIAPNSHWIVILILNKMLCHRSFAGLNLVNSSQWPKMNKYNAQVDDDDVFMVSIRSRPSNKHKTTNFLWFHV